MDGSAATSATCAPVQGSPNGMATEVEEATDVPAALAVTIPPAQRAELSMTAKSMEAGPLPIVVRAFPETEVSVAAAVAGSNVRPGTAVVHGVGRSLEMAVP